MDLKICLVNLSCRERQILYDITICDIQKVTNECICKVEADSQKYKNKFVVSKGEKEWGRGTLQIKD